MSPVEFYAMSPQAFYAIAEFKKELAKRLDGGGSKQSTLSPSERADLLALANAPDTGPPPRK